MRAYSFNCPTYNDSGQVVSMYAFLKHFGRVWFGTG